DGVGTERGRSSDCVLKRLLTTLCMVLTATAAWAQDPYRLASPVTNLATLFTDLFGPSGLIVDSEATLPGEQPHSAHFNSDFQSNFSKFNTALVNQFVTVPLPSPASGFTYRFDLSVAVPLGTNNLTVVSDATIQRLGTTNTLTHFFRLANGDVGNRRLFTAVGSAAGVGDLTVRMKTTIEKTSSAGLAVGLDIRLPTGDQMNLLGTGAAGFQPFAIVSGAYQKFS